MGIVSREGLCVADADMHANIAQGGKLLTGAFHRIGLREGKIARLVDVVFADTG